jgi:hypothetical protein
MYKFAIGAIFSSLILTADTFWVEKDFEEFYTDPLDMKRYPNHT